MLKQLKEYPLNLTFENIILHEIKKKHAAGAVVGPPFTPSATKSARSARGAAARARRSVAHVRHAKSSSFSRAASGSAVRE